MSELKIETTKIEQKLKKEEVESPDKPQWETPKLEDVSEQVMAQPYIRFT